MKKVFFAVAMLAAFNAHADSSHDTTGGSFEATINNGSTSSASGIGYGGSSNAVGVGGSGGEGGRGGDGGNAFQNQGQNQGQSQSMNNAGNSQSSSGVFGSGNSSNHISNANGIYGSGNSDNRNTNTNANANFNKAQGGTANSYSAGGRATGGNATGGNSGGNSQANAVNVQGDHVEYRAAASTAYAAPIAPTVNCASTASVGVQGLSFGISAGGSYKDANCEKLEQARFVAQVLGDKEAASAMTEELSPAYAKVMRKRRGEQEPQAAVETSSVDLYKQ